MGEREKRVSRWETPSQCRLVETCRLPPIGSPVTIQLFPFLVGAPKSTAKPQRHEYTSAQVEAVSKTAQPGAKIPQFTSDASKVQITGMGIKKAFVNKKSQFSVNAGVPGAGE